MEEAVNRSPVRLSFGLHGTLAVRLVITFILFAIVPVLVVGVPAAFWSIARTEQGALASLEASAVRQAEALEGAIQDWQAAVDALAADPKVAINLQVMMGMVEADARKEAHDNLVYRLEQFLAGHQSFQDAIIVDLEGTALLSTASYREGEDLSADPAVAWALGLPILSKAAVHWGPEQRTPVVAVPLRFSAGDTRAIFVAWLDDDAVARLLQGAAVTSLSSRTYLFSREGMVGAVPALGPSAAVSFGSPEIMRAALVGGSGVAKYRNDDGVVMLGAYRWLPTLRMGLLTEVPRQVVVEGVMGAIGRAVGLLYVVGWIGLVVAVAMARSISMPLVRLAQAAEQVAQGDLSVRVPSGGRDELGLLVRVFNTMTAQLEQSVGALEEEVAARTASLQRRTSQLEATIEVTRVAASTLEMDHLLQRVVDLISERFDFYHAGIFLLDETDEYAVLRAASSEGGKRMLARGHKLKVGEEGIVGYVAETGRPRIALDVGEDAVWFDNPDLPHTRSEMALPLKVRGRVIGVLDVQSTQEAAFTQEDITVLQVLADQVAIAIDNARLFQEAQENLQELEGLYGRYSREAWERLGQTYPIVGYRYDPSGLSPIFGDGAGEGEADEEAPVRIPLEVRGQVIGTLEVWPEQEALISDQITLLKAVGLRISQALESARLFQETQQRAWREQMLHQLTARFARSIDLDTVLQTAVRELAQLPHVAEASIHVSPPEVPPPANGGEEVAQDE